MIFAKMILKKDYPFLNIEDMKLKIPLIEDNKTCKLIERTIKTGKYVPLTDESLKEFEVEYEQNILCNI